MPDKTLASRRYYSQRSNAKRRNVDFNLTFSEWYNWWLSNGVDKNQPADPFTKNTLCMCRHNDCGPYQLTNIYCDSMANNSRRPGALNPMYGLKGSNQYSN